MVHTCLARASKEHDLHSGVQRSDDGKRRKVSSIRVARLDFHRESRQPRADSLCVPRLGCGREFHRDANLAPRPVFPTEVRGVGVNINTPRSTYSCTSAERAKLLSKLVARLHPACVVRAPARPSERKGRTKRGRQLVGPPDCPPASDDGLGSNVGLGRRA